MGKDTSHDRPAEIEVTKEMVEAGVSAAEVFRAMKRAESVADWNGTKEQETYFRYSIAYGSSDSLENPGKTILVNSTAKTA
jgi:hypothetical protein